jgi:hypothetical protein
MAGRFLDLANNVAYYLAMFFDALEERGPFHEVREVKVQVVIFRVWVQIAQVEMEQVRGLNTADCRHGVLIA